MLYYHISITAAEAMGRAEGAFYMKTALITGGGRGIGAATARRLAADGCKVAICYRENAQAAAAVVKETGGLALRCDVSEPNQVREMVDTVLEKFCQLDILLCAAGIAWQGLAQDMPPEKYRELMSVDLDGVFFTCQAALKPMLQQKSGRIITVSSMWGQVGGSCEVAYSAAKAGVIGLTKALAKEVGPSGITVNCIAPGVIDTDMVRPLGGEALAALAEETPLGRLGTAEDVAECVSFLCGRGGDFLTGQVIASNGGLVI